jgi:hypothetical protein
MNAQANIKIDISVQDFTKLVLPSGKVIDLMDENLLQVGLAAAAKVKRQYDIKRRQERLQQGF